MLAIQFFAQLCYFAGINYALEKNSSVSNIYHIYSANKIVDGDLTTRGTSSDNYITGELWWKVDIQRTIVFTHATIYVRGGTCQPSGSNAFDCCK